MAEPARPARPATGPARYVWPLVGVVTLIIPPLFLLLPRGGEGQTWVFILANVLGAAVVLSAPRLHRSRDRAPWYLLGIGLFVWVVANVVAYADRFLGEAGIGFPSPADGFYLAAPVFLVSGIALIVRRQAGGGSGFALLDAAIISLGACMLSWVFILGPIAHAAGVTPLVRATALAYPVTDLLLLAMLARLLVTPAVRIPSYWFLVGALAVQIVADTAYAIGSQAGTVVSGGVIDTGWPVAILLIAMAASHPSMRQLTRPVKDSDYSNQARLLPLVASALVTPVTIVMAEPSPVGVAIPAFLGGAMFLLVFVRMRGLLSIVQTAQTERGRILDQVFEAREQERTRLAGEIHDGPVQRLTALGMHLELATRRLDGGDTSASRASLEEVSGALGQEIHSLRGLMSDLRPPALDQNGLEDALRDELERFRRDTGIEAALEVEPGGRVDLEMETVLFRTAQEALTNVAKHSRASNVWVSVARPLDSVSLTVRDDGIGFSPRVLHSTQGRDHFGLLAMRERLRVSGGDARVESAPGAGTTVEVRVPTAETKHAAPTPDFPEMEGDNR